MQQLEDKRHNMREIRANLAVCCDKLKGLTEQLHRRPSVANDLHPYFGSVSAEAGIQRKIGKPCHFFSKRPSAF